MTLATGGYGYPGFAGFGILGISYRQRINGLEAGSLIF